MSTYNKSFRKIRDKQIYLFGTHYQTVNKGLSIQYFIKNSFFFQNSFTLIWLQEILDNNTKNRRTNKQSEITLFQTSVNKDIISIFHFSILYFYQTRIKACYYTNLKGEVKDSSQRSSHLELSSFKHRVMGNGCNQALFKWASSCLRTDFIVK